MLCYRQAMRKCEQTVGPARRRLHGGVRRASFGFGLLGCAVLAGCASEPDTQAPLYSGGDVARETRLATLESGMRELQRRGEARDQAIAGLDRALVGVRREVETTAGAHEAVRAEASEADARLAEGLDGLERRLSDLEARLGSMQTRLDALRQVSARAMEEAQRARALLNQQAAERAGITLPAAEDARAEETVASAARSAGDEEGDAAGSETGEAAAPRLPPEGFALHLASYRSPDAAREGWRDLRTAHADLLEGRQARLKTLDLGELGGQYLRLLVGPFSDVAPAHAVCDRLRRSGEFCQIAAFAGDPIGSSASP